MKLTGFFKTFPFLKNVSYRQYSSARRLVLGIETSCDDTGAAVVDENGVVLGEGFESQMKIHLDNGGVIPHIAVHFHKENIKSVVSSALENSKINLEDVSAIAVTTKPGLKGSLLVGVTYAKKLAEESQKPLIPVHHMEAHALTARLLHEIPFPFLCLLASGGHCQLTLVKGVNEFLLLGDSMHNSPGEVLDKIARRLKLQNLPECYEMSGGKAIDYMARGGDPKAFNFPLSMAQYRDCNFSFSGFISYSMTTIAREEEKHDVPADGVIPTVRDFCASLLHGYAVHLSHRIIRAFAFCEQENLISSNQRTLVFSGGVACNAYIKTALEQLCASSLNAKFFVPPPKLCTDNGIMIAWNGMEKLKANIDILPHIANLVPDPDCPLGIDLRKSVRKASIKIKSPKLDMKEREDLLLSSSS
ncbi:unnamed protein product [Larinioides sclopetarius]|uniref:N(6)-L-threonylcarbamoyladenine synthase n=1 Tax=Larinioides sclopetarius TaxID=280406 RepID=A0AAV2B7M3_9ARAC